MAYFNNMRITCLAYCTIALAIGWSLLDSASRSRARSRWRGVGNASLLVAGASVPSCGSSSKGVWLDEDGDGPLEGAGAATSALATCTTRGFPSVSVPVLSNTNVFACKHYQVIEEDEDNREEKIQ